MMENASVAEFFFKNSLPIKSTVSKDNIYDLNKVKSNKRAIVPLYQYLTETSFSIMLT